MMLQRRKVPLQSYFIRWRRHAAPQFGRAQGSRVIRASEGPYGWRGTAANGAPFFGRAPKAYGWIAAVDPDALLVCV